MKKISIIICELLMLFVSCGTQETPKTSSELKKEYEEAVKKEVAQEQRRKAIMQGKISFGDQMGGQTEIKKFFYEGHYYIMFKSDEYAHSDWATSCVGVVHDPDCSCFKRR